ncbi:MAG: exodeoxyribonuclease VII small subunit [Polyangiaceae bacterium]|nr:exodeoxyribonuclease VII small subunit [Polyangiaceae bacterium]MCB9609513.1 exodeoxyribonuclease VII small subunit [Polyangiaceae bacterium]
MPEAEAPALSFEDAVRRLGEIVERLEEGDLPLDESLDLFEEGIRLARASGQRLDAAEQRVEKLLSFDRSGEPIVEDLEDER